MATDPKGAKGAKDEKKGKKEGGEGGNNYFVGMTGDPDTSPDFKIRYISALVAQLGTLLGVTLNQGFVKQVLDRLIGSSVAGAVVLTTLGEAALNNTGVVRAVIEGVFGPRTPMENELIEKFLNSTVGGVNNDRIRYGSLSGPRVTRVIDQTVAEYKPKFDALPKPVTFVDLCNRLDRGYRYCLAQFMIGLERLPQARQDYWAKNCERITSNVLLCEILEVAYTEDMLNNIEEHNERVGNALDHMRRMLPKPPANVVQTFETKAKDALTTARKVLVRAMGTPERNEAMRERLLAQAQERTLEEERRNNRS